MVKVSAALKGNSEESGILIFKLSLDQIVPNRNQPRKLFKKESLEMMAKTIKKKGDVKSAIKVTPRGNKYMIVDGERRYRSSLLAEVNEISAEILPEMDDDEVFEISSLLNFCREDMSVIEKAFAFKRMIEKNGWSQTELAICVGLSQGTISNVMKVLKLNEEIQALLIHGKIDNGTGLILARYSEERQAILLDKCREAVKYNDGKPLPINAMQRLIKKEAEDLGFETKVTRKKQLTHAQMISRSVFRSMEKLLEELKELGKVPKSELGKLANPTVGQIINTAELLEEALAKTALAITP